MRIAIVDDVTAERSLFRSRLETQVQSRHLSVQILEYDSSEAFLAAANEQPFTVLFLDIYMSGITGAQTKLPNLEMHFSDNRTVDSVIGYYWGSAHQERIPFLAQIDFPEVLPVDEMDVCLVLSNLLENALEASMRMPESKRHIKAEVYMHSGRLMLISVENAFDGQIHEKGCCAEYEPQR